MNEYSDAQFIYGAVLFIGLLFLISKIGSGGKTLPNKPKQPEMTDQGRAFTSAEISGQFDSSALQAARAMISEVDRHQDSASRTLALAEMIHRQKQYEARQNDRADQAERKEYDMLDRVMQIAARFQGPAQATPPPAPRERHYPDDRYQEPYRPTRQRINGWEADRRQIPDDFDMHTRPGYWDRY